MFINLGAIATRNVQPSFAYGILRSSSLPMDMICLAVQGAALGVLFSNPMLGAAIGGIMSLTDRALAPIVNQLPFGRSYAVMGLPLGIKNTALFGGSLLLTLAILKAITVAAVIL